MKFLILFLGVILSINTLFAQIHSNDTIKISKLTDDQVKEMIPRCWPNIKDTIYYGEYFEGIKYGYSQYETFLDSNNREYGPIIIMKALSNNKFLSYNITEKASSKINEIYQLVPPYKLILHEEIEIKNGTTITNKTEKRGDVYISTFTDGQNSKNDTLHNFNYSLNEDWAQYLFGIDTISKINTVVQTRNNMDFENHSNYTINIKLLKREKKIINGIKHSYVTTDFNTGKGETGIVIEDEHLTIVELKNGQYSSRIEPKEVAINIEANQDLFYTCVIPIDYAFCTTVPRFDSIHYSEVLFEFDGNKNPFDTTLNQQFFSKNGKTYLKMSTQSPNVSNATQQEILENLKSTNFYPINDPLIIKLAEEATKGARSKRKKVDMLIKFVHNYIQYSKDDYSQHFISVYDIIRTKNGVCSDYAELFTALARSIGIPCQKVEGFALDPYDGSLGGHAWNEVELNGKWFGVDPTWNVWLPTYYHFKENKTDISCKDLSNMLLKLKSITYLNGKIVYFE
jgi:transglutaminase/protease-like cytokinesis protein 3